VVALEAAHGATLESETLEDLKAVIGHRPANPLEGLQAVDRLVRDDPAAHLTVLITYFGRLARRRMRLLAPLSDVDGWGNHEPVSANPAAEWTYALPELPAWI
jgi:hypothetical protein